MKLFRKTPPPTDTSLDPLNTLLEFYSDPASLDQPHTHFPNLPEPFIWHITTPGHSSFYTLSIRAYDQEILSETVLTHHLDQDTDMATLINTAHSTVSHLHRSTRPKVVHPWI